MAILGIDVSKDTVDAALLTDEGQVWKKVSNNAKGFEQLKRWLTNRKAKDVHACMEATGSYYEALAEALVQMGYLVSVVNPAQIKAFSQSLLSRTKTDKIDAHIIAEFCKAHRPSAWIPLSPKERTLRGLVRLAANLKETRASYQVQLQTPNIIPSAKRSIKQLLKSLDAQVKAIEQEIAEVIDGDPDLKRRHRLLTSIEGIGEGTASMILAEAPRLHEFRNAKSVAAFAGLSSHQRASGTSVRGRGAICKIGNSRLRSGLWWPAIVAMIHNTRLRAFAQRLRQAGKPNKKIIVAAMRKLLTFAYGVLKAETPYRKGALTASC